MNFKHKTLRFPSGGERLWGRNFFLPVIALIIIAGGFFFFSQAGGFINHIRVKSYSIVKDIYHAQEYGDTIALLKGDINNLTQELIGLKKLEQENALLKSELGIDPMRINPMRIKNERLGAKKKEIRFVNANVIAKGFGFGAQVILIDAGSLENIQPGNAVIIPPNIFIGIVTSVSSKTSSIQLISDNGFQAQAQSLSGLAGVIKGATGGQIIFDEISQGAKVKENDLILTANENIGTPSGLVMGKIGPVLSHPADPVQKTQAILLFDPYLLDSVGIIIQQ